MIRRASRLAFAFAGLGIGLLALVGRPGGALALEFQCIEASKYKSLMRIFQDDPANFSSYFSLPRDQRPPADACRALIATGTIAKGDTRKFLEHVSQNKGWLAVIYLSHSGLAAEEEVKLATAIRELGLKTRYPGGTGPARYAPDFASAARLPPPSSTNAWPAVPPPTANPFNRALNDYYQVTQVNLPVPADQNWCRDGCVSLFLSGVHRYAMWKTGSDPQGGVPPTADPQSLRLRALWQHHLDTGQNVASGASVPPLLNMTSSRPTPAFSVQLLRTKCGADIDATAGLQDQIKTTVDELSKRNFDRFVRIDTMMPRFETLQKVTARLERCIAGTYERERLAKFKQRCASACEIDRMDEEFGKLAREFIDKAK